MKVTDHCPRCGSVNRKECPNCKIKKFKPGQLVKHLNGRTGCVAVDQPKWLKRELGILVEWDDDKNPKESRTFPGWIEKNNG